MGAGPRRRAAPAVVRARRRGLRARSGAFLLVQLTAWPPHEDETLALFVGRGSMPGLSRRCSASAAARRSTSCSPGSSAHTGGGLRRCGSSRRSSPSASVPVVALLAGGSRAGTTALVRLRRARRAGCCSSTGSTRACTASSSSRARSRTSRCCTRPSTAGGGAWAALGGSRRALRRVASVRRARRRVAGAVGARHARAGCASRCPRSRPSGSSALPFWYTDLVLAKRFDVGVGGGGGKLNGPLDVLDYLVRRAATSWPAGASRSARAAARRASGFVALARRSSRGSAARRVRVRGAGDRVPDGADRLVGGPESRHLIFTFPFFALLVALGLLRFGRIAPVAIVAACGGGRAGLGAQPHAAPLRRRACVTAGRAGRCVERGSRETSRPNDILFGYDPLFLRRRVERHRFSSTVIPRADPVLALDALATRRARSAGHLGAGRERHEQLRPAADDRAARPPPRRRSSTRGASARSSSCGRASRSAPRRGSSRTPRA